MTGLLHDLRYALRQLRKSPGFAAVAIMTLALGIGANTAVFSTLNTLLLKMLPVRDPQHVYTLTLVNGGTQAPNTDGTGNGNTSFSYPVYEALRQQTRVLADVIIQVPLAVAKVPVRYGSVPAEKSGEEVSGNFFSGLGVEMLRGSGFTEADERNHTPVAVLSYGFWTDAFARDPAVLGQTLYVKGIPFTIIGVTAPSFYGVRPGTATDFWIPLQNRAELNAWSAPLSRADYFGSPRWWDLPMLVRLQPHITPQQAEQILQPAFWNAASEGSGTLDPKTWPAHLGFEPVLGIANYAKNYREPAEIMMALVGLVLLIACTNVALLVLARHAARRRDFVVRIAVGAQRLALFRQLLAESLLLVTIGAGLGWLLAIAATHALAGWAGIDTGLAPDRHVLLFTLLIASLAALVFGLVPWAATSRIRVEQELKSNSARVGQSRARARGGNVAIALQIAMCLTLLVASGLSVRSLLNYERQDLGMDAERLLIFDVNPQGIADNGQALLFYQRLLDRLRSIPGVRAVSLVRWRLGAGWNHTSGTSIDGVELLDSSGARVEVHSQSLGPDFFHTIGVPVLQGRDFTEADAPTSPQVAIVNQYFAEKYLKDGAIGHRLDSLPGAEIVGVVKDSNYAGVAEDKLPTVYYPLSQNGMMGPMTVEIRAMGDPMALLPDMQRAIHDLDPNLPLQNSMSQAAQFAETYVTPQLFARLSLAFGVLAIALVATGLYGTLAYRVQRRRGEIGVRMALGARREDVLRMVLRESLFIACIGFALGLPMSFAVSRLLRAQLYHLSYLDSFTFSTAIFVTLSVALLASFLPAHRAAKVDPMEALRYE